jgi:hypothetical protein
MLVKESIERIEVSMWSFAFLACEPNSTGYRDKSQQIQSGSTHSAHEEPKPSFV